MKKIKGIVTKVSTKAFLALNNQRGDGSDAMSLLQKIVIGVIIGGIVLGLLTAAIPDLWILIINKIKSTFSL